MLERGTLDSSDDLGPPSTARLAVPLIDLHRFRAVNDAAGHAMGDAILIGAGARLRNLVRETDTVARCGGDEFAVLLHGAGHLARVTAFARRVITSMAKPFTDGNDSERPSAAMSALPDDVAYVLRDSGLESNQLVLELTESVLVEDAPATLEQLGGFKKPGVRLAVDDFGAGYSSLAYRRR
ncbi:diguanylate cyclase [Actinoplanes sp. NPDC023801]|uniref:diguanylate cyclase domain-containing protein n=1 Tax=Actinoplanes sp. NPDC023801 TaxID=3154595 RepID=UPI00340AF846